jgi:hypothetical protein
MTSGDDDTARAMAIDFARLMVPFWQGLLGSRLLGFYLLGSLAHDGFSRRYSDIDLGLISEEGLDDRMLDEARAEATRLSAELAPKLSLFWSNRNFSVGRFPPLDRVDYLDHAVTLVEAERVNPARPSLDEIRTYLSGAPFAGWAARVAHFSDLDHLASNDHKPYLRAILYAARFIYSWQTGRMASNDAAVVFLRTGRPAGLDLELVERALDCRHRAADPGELFDHRHKLPDLVNVCALLVEAQGVLAGHSGVKNCFPISR